MCPVPASLAFPSTTLTADPFLLPASGWSAILVWNASSFSLLPDINIAQELTLTVAALVANTVEPSETLSASLFCQLGLHQCLAHWRTSAWSGQQFHWGPVCTH